MGLGCISSSPSFISAVICPNLTRKINRTLLAASLAATAAGCATYVTSTEGADFDKSVKIVATSLKAALSEVQSVEVEISVDAYAKGNARTLEHLSIEPRLSDSTVKVITGQFDFLAKYSEALRDTTSPGTSWGKSVDGINSAEAKLMGDAEGLDNKMSGRTVLTDANVQTFDKDASGIAKAVSTIGEAALTLYGEEKASKIAAAVNPDLQKYCTDLENLLTSDPESKIPRTGLAGILSADYEERIASIKYMATTALPPSGPDDPNYFNLVQQRRTILNEYTALLDGEKSGLERVLTLRKAVAEIAKAHEALANKDDVTFKQKISNSEELVRSLTKGGEAAADTLAK